MAAPQEEPREPEDAATELADIAGEGSFPASDPPSWTLGRDPAPAPPGEREGRPRAGAYCGVPYRPARLTPAEMLARGRAFYDLMAARRSVRRFAPDPVPRALVELAIATAATAPSGAHRQPWTFVAVSDPALKREIRIAAEAEERESYLGGRMPTEWLEALAPLGTTWQKPFLETVPWIVVVFEQLWSPGPGGGKRKNYYPKESVGIASGLFVAALHHMGLATLTHTPSPMAFLSRLLDRPPNEKPFILFPIGYPAPDAEVPDLRRKSLDEVAVWRTEE
jgi:nitroreductase